MTSLKRFLARSIRRSILLTSFALPLAMADSPEPRALIRLGLVEEARIKAIQSLVSESDPDTSTSSGTFSGASSWLALSDLFSEEGMPETALELIELARLQAPSDPRTHLAALPYYHRKGWLRAMADALEKASLFDAQYFHSAAEIRRQTGEFQLSEWWGLQARSGPERVRERISSAVERGRWDLVAAMEGAVSREELSRDDEVNYALGYSLVRIGQFERAERFLGGIREPRLLEKTAALRKARSRSSTPSPAQ